MRILFIHQYFKTRTDSSYTRTYEFARRWAAAGHSVTVLTADTEPNRKGLLGVRRYEVDGIKVIAIASAYSNYMRYARRYWAFFCFMVASVWRGLFTAERPDLVYASSAPLTVGITGLIVSRLRRASYVFEVRDLWPEAPIQVGALRNPIAIWLARWLERTLYRAAQHVVNLSPGAHEALVNMGVPGHRLSMVPNCSDLDLFLPCPADPEVARSLGLDSKFVVAYAGAMGMANGLMPVIETAAVLRARGDEKIHLLLIGDGSERPSLEQAIAKKGLSNISLLRPMPKRDLAPWLCVSDAILVSFAHFPVLETCSPNKLFDGLALGRPIVINYGGWMQSLIETHGVGMAAPSGQPEELASTLQSLASDPERVAEMGKRARALAEERFDRDILAAELLATLETIASNGHA